MSDSRGLVSVLSSTDGEIADRLDDTLLNRLEYALYCEHECHIDFWNNFHTSNFKEFLDIIGDNVEDSELPRGKLKIEFAIVWRMREYCTPSNLERIKGLLCPVIINKKCSVLSSLHTFFNKNLYERSPIDIFDNIVDLDFSVLIDWYQESSNVNYRRSLIQIFALLLRSSIKLGGSSDFEGLDKNAKLMNTSPVNISFLVDLLTELIRLYIQTNEEIWSAFLKWSAEKMLPFLIVNKEVDVPDENSFYLVILLSPYYSKSIESAVNTITRSSNVASYLRRLLTSGVFQDTSLHRALVNVWYDQVGRYFAASEDTPFPRAFMSFLSCQKDFLQYSAFQDLLPSKFIESIWERCVYLLSHRNNTVVLQNVWSLFNRFCPLQSDASRQQELDFLLNEFRKQPELLGEFSVLLDCAYTLYSSFPSYTFTEHMDVFQRVYDLAHEECSNLKCSGGHLSYSFLLLKIYQSSSANKSVALQLLQLQKIVSRQIAEEPLLVANETVIEMHRGFFITPLLSSQTPEVFSHQFCADLLELVKHLHKAKETISDEQVFPSTLKGVLLACLFRCLGNPDVIERLKCSGAYRFALEVCDDLGSAEWEEDATIRRWIGECWTDFSKVIHLILLTLTCISRQSKMKILRKLRSLYNT